MKNKKNKKGFSLAEILMSLGILSIGMLLIAAVFPAGIHFTTIATERTIASSVADEAFAKIKIYSSDPNFDPVILGNILETFPPVPSPFSSAFNDNVECSYPSDDALDVSRRMYSWSALWRRTSGRNVQVTVFVSRRATAGTMYYEADATGNLSGDEGLWPVPLHVNVQAGEYPNQIDVMQGSPQSNFINPGCTIVDSINGRIYRVLDRIENVVFLDGDWLGTTEKTDVWVVAPPVGGGRYPCIAVYQKVMRF